VAEGEKNLETEHDGDAENAIVSREMTACDGRSTNLKRQQPALAAHKRKARKCHCARSAERAGAPPGVEPGPPLPLLSRLRHRDFSKPVRGPASGALCPVELRRDSTVTDPQTLGKADTWEECNARKQRCRVLLPSSLFSAAAPSKQGYIWNHRRERRVVRPLPSFSTGVTRKLFVALALENRGEQLR
jgi:hypothetical protein